VRIEQVRDEEDVDAIVALEAESFTNPWSRETLLWELRNSDVTYIYVLKRDDSQVVAFCICWMLFDELHINTVAVAPGSRRQGLALALLRYVLGEAVARGIRRATLEVRASNAAAIALYERLGFQITARREHYYTNPEEDALILWKEELPSNALP
jgi:ribosomal-protein-alanine N-acetyltransferase